MHPKDIGGAAITPGALTKCKYIWVNCLNYENCIAKFEKIQVCKLVCFEHTQLFGEFNYKISFLRIFLKFLFCSSALTSTQPSKIFIMLTSSCILRVLAAPPIPPRPLPSANIRGVNCLNYKNCIEEFETIQVCKLVCFEYTQFFG